jgi:hypothetical protein
LPFVHFTEEERAEVAQAIRAVIDGDRYVLSPRVKRLKSALAKLDPASAECAVTPFAPPKHHPGAPSLVYQRLKSGRDGLERAHSPRRRSVSCKPPTGVQAFCEPSILRCEGTQLVADMLNRLSFGSATEFLGYCSKYAARSSALLI